MDIILDNLDNITQNKYKEFQKQVQELLNTYKQTDSSRFDLVKRKIEQANGNWDTSINLISGNSIEHVNISELLAYEYCLAGEKITNGKVSFENMLEKLFKGVQKFRIGNPVPGLDDECLYGKSYDDKTAIPVTSNMYRIVMNAGAQYLEYFKNNNPTGAVYIYKKGVIKNIAQDENGNFVDIYTDGINFDNLSHGQSLLTNLRQTAFHEWTHNSEKEFIDETDSSSIAYEYQGADGKTYRNYQKINSYVTAENIGAFQEPQYIISTEKDENGNRKRFFKNKSGNLRPLSEVTFGLEERELETEICIATGLSTNEVIPDGNIVLHNIITEGFVEKTARDMILAIDPEVKDIDDEKYSEYVEIANKIVPARDNSLGVNGKGQTFADFLMHSTILKRDLESRTVVLDDNSKVDGLHYISNYADSVQNRTTRKAKFYANMKDIVKFLNLSNEQKDTVQQSDLWQKETLTEDEQDVLKSLLVCGNTHNQEYVDALITDYIDILREETEFFDGIAEKLGYTQRTIAGQKPIHELVAETSKEYRDTTFLDELQQAQARQEKLLANTKNNQKGTESK